MIYATGGAAITVNSNVMTIDTAAASNGDGGVFHFTSGSTTMSLTTPTFKSVSATQNGGIGSFGGTAVSVTASTFNVDTCDATNGNGGCFYYANSGASTININGGGVSTRSKA